MGQTAPLTLEEILPTFTTLLQGPLALAVSGGSDSVALMHLVAEWLREPAIAARQNMGPTPVQVLTVDHRLRPQSAEEAAWVGARAAELELPHSTLVWDGPKPTTGIAAAARAARYGLINAFLEREIETRPGQPKRAVVTAHHADDQAETFLMRLERGSGLDGLSGMRDSEWIVPASTLPDARYLVLRPLLQVPKARLTAYLQVRRLTWREDPSNRATDFERVRIREALQVLGGLGVSAEQISLSTRRLARAREAVLAVMHDVMNQIVHWHRGIYAEIDPQLFTDYADELQVRALAELMAVYGGEAPRPRLSQVEALVRQIRALAAGCAQGPDGGRMAVTLGGCRIERRAGGPVRLWREAGREGLAQFELHPGAQRLWDHRFLVGLAAGEQVLLVRALGPDGVRHVRADPGLGHVPVGAGMPASAVETLPSFWRDGRLLAVPGLNPSDSQAVCSARFRAADDLGGHC